jgi:large subunit ribosomal protein L21
MYAIIRAGGKQTKVSEGDVVDVERVKTDGEVSFVPLLIVEKNGTVISDRKELAKAKVTAEVLGESSGPKVDIFKYKAKTGYRRRAGHRQTYSQLKIKKIDVPGAKKATPKASTTEKAAPKSTAAEKPAAAKTASATKPAAKKPAATKKATTTKAAAKKPAAKKPAAKKPAAKKPKEGA